MLSSEITLTMRDAGTRERYRGNVTLESSPPPPFLQIEVKKEREVDDGLCQ